jgi:hypothetical protein
VLLRQYVAANLPGARWAAVYRYDQGQGGQMISETFVLAARGAIATVLID